MKTISTSKSHGGIQGVYSHASDACACDMTFAVFVPPQADDGPCPVVWYLSGLTCTPQNVMDKGEYRRLAAELGLIVVCPDTSPRGAAVEALPGASASWDFGIGAGFYLDATEAPWAAHWRMESWIVQELLPLVAATMVVTLLAVRVLHSARAARWLDDPVETGQRLRATVAERRTA